MAMSNKSSDDQNLCMGQQNTKEVFNSSKAKAKFKREFVQMP